MRDALFLGAVLTFAACEQADPQSEKANQLAADLHQIISDYPEATVGIAVRDLDSGLSLGLNEDHVFHAASTMKVPVMIEVVKRVHGGLLALDDSIRVINEFRSIVDGSTYSMDIGEDSDDDVYAAIGRDVPIAWLVNRMITVSSNLATNILIELVGAENVQSTIEEMGTTTMRVYRGVEDLIAFDRGLNNTATAADLATLFTAIAQRTAVSPEADDAMIEILSRQEFNDMIPAGLPAGTHVAHKTGSITRIDHDAGIVYPDGREPYVVVILTGGIDDKSRSAELGSRISNSVYEHVLTATPID